MKLPSLSLNQAETWGPAAATPPPFNLGRLSGKEPALWRQVNDLVATRKPKSYDAAVKILVDLRASAG